MRTLTAALLALAAACAHSDRHASSGGREVQLLFTGDGHGEVGPCG